MNRAVKINKKIDIAKTADFGNTDSIIDGVAASMSFEGLEIPADEKERGRELLKGNTTADREIIRIKRKYGV